VRFVVLKNRKACDIFSCLGYWDIMKF